MDEWRDLARVYRALGDPTRLQIFEFLRTRPTAVALEDNGAAHRLNGPTVGEVCCHVTGLDRINSTISFHIRELKDAGLINVEKQGKYMICSVNLSTFARLQAHLSPATETKEACECHA